MTKGGLAASSKSEVTGPLAKRRSWGAFMQNWIRERLVSVAPSLVYLASWTGLTALGAAYAIMPSGRARLGMFLGTPDSTVFGEIGSPTYYALLLAPYVIVPAMGLLGYRTTKHFISKFPKLHLIVSPGILYLILILAIGYTVLKLIQTGHLVPTLILQGANYTEIIAQRSTIISDLRFLPYVMIYAIIPSISVMSLGVMLRNCPSLHYLLLLFLSFLSVYYFTFVIFMKAPLIIYFMMLIITVILSWRALWLVPLIAIAAVVTFLSMQVLIGGFDVPGGAEPSSDKGRMLNDSAPAGITLGDSTDWKRMRPPGSRPEQPSVWRRYEAALWNTVESVLFRMGSAFPYYVAVFKNPAERCGVETNSLPLLPKPKCVMARKVFDVMYPTVTWAKGFAPAAAHVSAYGAVGLGFSVLVLVFIGLSLGMLGALAAVGTGPISTAIGVAVSIYAYNLAQVPVLGAISYSNGLMFLLAVPLACAAWAIAFKRAG